MRAPLTAPDAGRYGRTAPLAATAVALLALTACGQRTPPPRLSTAEVDALLQRLNEQDRRLQAQEEVLLAQRDTVTALLAEVRGRGLPPTPARRGRMGDRPYWTAQAQEQTQEQAQASPQDTPPSRRPPQADARPAAGQRAAQADSGADQPAERDVELAVIHDVGGVLTPAGQVAVEPELSFATSSSNRFFFQGIEVVEAVLFGLIEASETERETLTAALGARYGINNRWEVDARVPYVYRNDRTTSTGVNDPTFSTIRDLEGHGIGDVEAGLHYQINQGNDGWPVLVGNMRVKAPTGVGPFDVNYTPLGLEDDLPTGSGFWSVEPSITAIIPTAPAVIFGNLGYGWNIGRDVDKDIPNSLDTVDGVTHIGEVDPGDAINLSFGLGLGLNDALSLSFGYEHSYVLSTTTEVDGATSKSDPVHVGSLVIGGNYAFNERTAVELRVSAGLTEEAPDTRVTLRVPVRF